MPPSEKASWNTNNGRRFERDRSVYNDLSERSLVRMSKAYLRFWGCWDEAAAAKTLILSSWGLRPSDDCWCAIFANNYWIVWRTQGTLDLWPKLKGPLTILPGHGCPFAHKYTQGADSHLKERSVTRIAKGESIKCWLIRLMDLMVPSLKSTWSLLENQMQDFGGG